MQLTAHARSPILDAGEISRAASQSRLMRNFRLRKKQVGLFLDPWRCSGSLSNAGIPFSMKHLAMLPKSHNLSTLIVSTQVVT